MKAPNFNYRGPQSATSKLLSFKEFINESRRSDAEEEPQYTGRFFMVFDQGVSPLRYRSMIGTKTGIRVANSSDFQTKALNEEMLGDAEALVYEDLGIALVGAEEEQVGILAEGLQGYTMIPELIARIPDDRESALIVPSLWSIQAVRAHQTKATGQNVNLAVLDTGFDIGHPDFAGRTIVSAAFDGGETAQDGHGHGTHCIGTACGGTDFNGIRYGVASQSNIFAGKVLGDNGSGAQAWILNGMSWATEQGCKVISMSLGSPVTIGARPNPVYLRAVRAAMAGGSLVVAAAGNESRRAHGHIAPVVAPANCGAFAVGAVDSDNAVADFSCGGLNAGQEVHAAAPGVDIYSSWTRTSGSGARYRTISGTSMATPHVAGIAALHAQLNPAATPAQLFQLVRASCLNLGLPVRDVGNGLVQAP